MKYAWPALGTALLVMGCVQLQGSPAMRPHAARGAAEAEAAASPSADTPSPAPSGIAESTDAPEGPSSSGSEASRDDVGGRSWMPPAAESASWDGDRDAVAMAAGIAPAGWLYPLTGFTAEWVIGRFGDPRDGGERSHEGLDIRAARGTPVLAPVPGLVIASGRRGLAGNLVILLDELEGREFYFAHLDARVVQRGERVSAGQQIGTVGTTGNANGTTPHLHFEVREAAGPIDPYPLLVGAGSGARAR